MPPGGRGVCGRARRSQPPDRFRTPRRPAPPTPLSRGLPVRAGRPRQARRMRKERSLRPARRARRARQARRMPNRRSTPAGAADAEGAAGTELTGFPPHLACHLPHHAPTPECPKLRQEKAFSAMVPVRLGLLGLLGPKSQNYFLDLLTYPVHGPRVELPIPSLRGTGVPVLPRDSGLFSPPPPGE